VTAVVALWGAGLSTYLAIVGRIEQRRQVEVTLLQELAEINTETGVARAGLFIRAANTGKRPVTLYSPSLEARPGGIYWGIFECRPGVSFPMELTEGRECTVRVRAEALASGIEKDREAKDVWLIAAFSDATGRTYRSKPMQASSTALRQLLP
jgi:hypothetical protein